MPLSRIISVPYAPETQRFVGAYKGKNCLIVASGRCLWNDLGSGMMDPEKWDVMAVNQAILHYPGPVLHGYSNHGDRLPDWRTVRKFHYQGPDFLHSNGEWGNGVYGWPIPGMGSSGLSAAVVALCMGYDQVLLAGMPLDDSGHFYDPPGVKTNFTREAPDDIWRMFAAEVFDGRVKSLSGRSREILGGP